MRYPCVTQIDVTDCAAACLSTICKYYKKIVSITTIRKYANTDKNGTNGIGLIKAANKLGFNCDAYSIEEKKIEDNVIENPFIAHVNMHGLNHYVVVYEYNKNNVTIADPAEGIKKYPLSEFKAFWTGVIFTLQTNSTFKNIANENSNLKKMISLIGAEKKSVVKIAVLSIFYTVLGIVGAMFFNLLFDDIVPDKNIIKLKTAAVCFAGISIFQMLFHFIRVKLLVKLERNLDKEITLKTFKHILHLPLSFFAMRQTGEIISRLNDSYKIRDALSGASISVFIDSIMAVICGIFLCYVDYRLFLITFSIVVLYFIFNRIFKEKIKSDQRTVLESNADVNSSYVEMIKGMETIKSYGAENYIDNSSSGIFDKFINSCSKLENTQNNLGFYLSTVQAVGYIFILSVGALMVINNSLSLGSLLSFYSLLGYFLKPLFSLINLQINLQGALIAFERINDIRENEVECLNEGKKTFEKINSIEMRNLSFKYGERRPIIKNVSLKFPIGKRVAVVGESGSGKTTLAKLLMGFYNLEKGDIYYNNTKINEIDKTWLRNKIVYVSQEPYFFNGTIRDNLLFGLEKTDVNDEKIMELAKKLHIDQLITSSPDGLSANLQEGASNISGGQKQRLALLRAFLHDPEVIIMDEATSHLDTITEKIITESIESMDKDVSLLIIAHRLSTIKSCDHIFVLNDGQLIEEGHHDELLAKDGYYTALWKNAV